MKIERASIEDLSDIVAIYNWAIINTAATFDTEVKSVDSQKAWFDEHDDQYPIYIIRDRDGGKVVAWGAISRWSDRCAYSGTGETSLYVHPDFQGLGMGSALLVKLIEIGEVNNFRTLVSRIAGVSKVSIHLHEKLNFRNIGTMKNVGKKFGEIIDVHLMQVLF